MTFTLPFLINLEWILVLQVFIVHFDVLSFNLIRDMSLMLLIDVKIVDLIVFDKS